MRLPKSFDACRNPSTSATKHVDDHEDDRFDIRIGARSGVCPHVVSVLSLRLAI
jgi:hypothetical protein